MDSDVGQSQHRDCYAIATEVSYPETLKMFAKQMFRKCSSAYKFIKMFLNFLEQLMLHSAKKYQL